jgi:hypothetical protein
MHEYLYKYVALNQKLTIPGVGSFIAETEPAKLNFVERTVHSPLPLIKFTTDNNSSTNDFCRFLAKEIHIDEADAAEKFNEFSGELKNSLKKNGTVTLPGIGVLTMQFGNTFSFTSQENIQSFFPHLNAERVIRKNTGHNVIVGEKEKTSAQMQEELLHDKEIKKEKWRIYAMVLAVIGIASIVIYKAMH